MIAPSPLPMSVVARARVLPPSLRGFSASYHRPLPVDQGVVPAGDPISNAPITGGGPPSQPWIHYVDRVAGDRTDPQFVPIARNPSAFCNRPELIPGQAQPDNYPPGVTATPPMSLATYSPAGAPGGYAGAGAPAPTEPLPMWVRWTWALAATASAAASGYHGYKRNEHTSDAPALWAALWFMGGSVLPVFMPVLAIAQGYAKPAR